MDTIHGGLLQWLDSSEAALGLVIAVVGGVASAWYSWHQRNLARRERAADLFDRFYSPEGYHAMVAPVFVVTLRWYSLRGRDREAYAAALCKGWTGQEHAGRLLTAYVGTEDVGERAGTGSPGGEGSGSGTATRAEASATRVEAFERIHFHRARSTEEITEHAALTAFLYFWVKLQAMIEAHLVSRRLARELFRQPYAIYAPFIADFRQAVIESPDTGDVRPAWIDATRKLERFLLGVESGDGTFSGATAAAAGVERGTGPQGP